MRCIGFSQYYAMITNKSIILRICNINIALYYKTNTLVFGHIIHICFDFIMTYFPALTISWFFKRRAKVNPHTICCYTMYAHCSVSVLFSCIKAVKTEWNEMSPLSLTNRHLYLSNLYRLIVPLINHLPLHI
jgi:hypothetical protein